MPFGFKLSLNSRNLSFYILIWCTLPLVQQTSFKYLPQPAPAQPSSKKAKTKRARVNINSLKSRFFKLQTDTQLVLDQGRDAMKRSSNQDYAQKLVQKLCSKVGSSVVLAHCLRKHKTYVSALY